MKRFLSFLSNGALMLVYLCAALAVCEAGARFLFKDKGSVVLVPRYHTDYRYGKYHLRGIRPNADFWHTSVDGSWEFRTDSRGFRNEQNYAYGKHPGALRILSIGDSMTQGYEVRQNYTFSAVAQRYLKHLGVQAQVINAGVSGYSTEEELAFLENEGYKYQPDVVVLGFYANDFDDNVRSALFDLDSQGRLVAKRYEYLPGVAIQNVIYRLPGMAWLSENSYAYSVLFNGVWAYFKNRSVASAHSSIQAHAPVGALEYAVPMRESLSEHDIALAAALIEDMNRFCQERSIRLIVVDIPDASGTRSVSSMPPALLSRLSAKGVEIVSGPALLAPYEGAAETHVPHGDRHISEFTHTLLGVEIARRIRSGTVAHGQQALAN